MILDLARFAAAERPYWDELQQLLDALEESPERRMTLAEVQRLHYLYERCSAALARLDTPDPQLRPYLESLVSRAYTEIHETRAPIQFRWREWILAFPRAVRRHSRALALSIAITLLGCAFGGFAIRHDPNAKPVLLPFSHLHGSPADRVAQEESVTSDRLANRKARFSAMLISNNVGVTIKALAFGVTWGIGTILVLFYNGVILGAVCVDYIAAGQGRFLTAWLLPHGSTEIPAILLGGQAGLIIAAALIGWGERTTRVERFRAVAPDLFAIVAGAAVLLVWAGIVESFVSQYHQPVLPYSLKIGFGIVELCALGGFLGWAGRR